MEELNVGLAGVSAAVLLSVCTPSAPLLLALGGAGQVMREHGSRRQGVGANVLLHDK